jgi:hypothetical protein
VLALTEKVVVPVRFWTEFSSPAHKGAAAVQTAIATPSEDALVRTAASQDAAWFEGMKSYCTPTTTRWYCKQGNRQ